METFERRRTIAARGASVADPNDLASVDRGQGEVAVRTPGPAARRGIGRQEAVQAIGHKLWAFLRKGMRVDASYKVAFALGILGALAPVASFYFLSQLVSEDSVYLQKYGADYFSFVLIGVALSQYFTTATVSFSSNIVRAQTSGVLEAMVNTKTRSYAVLLYDSAFSFLKASLHAIVILVVGAIGFGVDYSRANLLSLGLVIPLALAAISAFGTLSATMIVVLKRGDPIRFFWSTGTSLLSGAFFPTAVLPGWLVPVANLLPITHAIEATRLAVFKAATPAELAPSLALLAAVSLLLFPASLAAFHFAVEKGRRDGTLSHY